MGASESSAFRHEDLRQPTTTYELRGDTPTHLTPLTGAPVNPPPLQTYQRDNPDNMQPLLSHPLSPSLSDMLFTL